MRKGDAKYKCPKCEMRGICSEKGPAPKCHVCKDGTLMVQVGEPEYSHGKKADTVIKVMVYVPYEISFRGETGKQEAIKALERETPWQLMSSAGFSVKQLGGNTVHE